MEERRTTPGYERLAFANGHFFAEYDWRRNVIMGVHRGGTVYFDLTRIAEEARQREEKEKVDTTANE